MTVIYYQQHYTWTIWWVDFGRLLMAIVALAMIIGWIYAPDVQMITGSRPYEKNWRTIGGYYLDFFLNITDWCGNLIWLLHMSHANQWIKLALYWNVTLPIIITMLI